MLYAAYGSNLHPRRLQARTPSAQLLGTGTLHGYSLHFDKRSNDRSAKCTIRESRNFVLVAVYELSAPDKIVLDGIEGVGDGYDQLSVPISGFGECFTYIAAETHIDASLAAYDWYHQLVLAGAQLHDFPRTYLQAIEQVVTMLDPDSSRSRDRWATVESLRNGD